MTTFYNQDTIRRLLDTYAQKRQPGNDYMTAPDWNTLTPQVSLALQQPMIAQDPTEYFNKLIDIGNQQTNIERIKSDNRDEYQAYLDAQQQNKLAHQNFVKQQQYQTPGGPAIQQSPGTYNPKQWGADRIPEVSDIKVLNPHAPLVTMHFHGISYQVNSQVAPIFQSFLTDLYRSGYHPKVIGGYRPGPIEGTNVPSLHGYGFAIDIDPSRNPVTWNGKTITALPPGVAALAAKYGLSWGGAWHHNKRDSMHFSVPYDHTE